MDLRSIMEPAQTVVEKSEHPHKIISWGDDYLLVETHTRRLFQVSPEWVNEMVLYLNRLFKTDQGQDIRPVSILSRLVDARATVTGVLPFFQDQEAVYGLYTWCNQDGGAQVPWQYYIQAIFPTPERVTAFVNFLHTSECTIPTTLSISVFMLYVRWISESNSPQKTPPEAPSWKTFRDEIRKSHGAPWMNDDSPSYQPCQLRCPSSYTITWLTMPAAHMAWVMYNLDETSWTNFFPGSVPRNTDDIGPWARAQQDTNNHLALQFVELWCAIKNGRPATVIEPLPAVVRR